MGGSVAHTARTKADEAELSSDSQKLQISDPASGMHSLTLCWVGEKEEPLVPLA